MPRSPSNEFLLAAACCRWPPSATRDEAIRDALTEGVDWQAFLGIVRRQRVEGLAHAALRHAGVDTPQDIAAELGAAAAAITRENLLHAAASLRLKGLFAEAGLPILFVKGVTLSLLAYGTLGLKKARDIDVVVPAKALALAFDLLRQAGYRLAESNASAEDEVVAGLAKETVWKDDAGILLELHSGLVDNSLMLPGIGVHSPTQQVAIAPGKGLPTLQKDALFSYLCVHGATHAWSRLKWLADVAALLSREDEAETERLYRMSVGLGAGRSAAQGLLLCSKLLGARLPKGLVQELEADWATRWLVRVAMKSMAGAHGATELDETVLGTVPIHFSHFLMMRGAKYKLSELKRKAGGRPSAASRSLPAYLRFLHPLVAVPLWLRTRARERIRR